MAIIRPYKGGLLLNKLRFQEEIRPQDELDLPKGIRVDKAEMNMALQLIKRHEGPFNIGDYNDEYSKELMKMIRAKAKGKRPVMRKFKPVNTDPNNLLEQLKASLG